MSEWKFNGPGRFAILACPDIINIPDGYTLTYTLSEPFGEIPKMGVARIVVDDKNFFETHYSTCAGSHRFDANFRTTMPEQQ